MRYLGFATDYDGTLARNGRVDPETAAAVGRCRASGRKTILVTGRELRDLLAIFPEIGQFDRVVAENGGVLYNPATRKTTVLAPPPAPEFVSALERREVSPLSLGEVVVATWESNRQHVLDAVRETGLELQIVFNKGALMVLPSGVNKATGLEAAAAELGLSRHNIVAVGDAENDHAFLEASEFSAAVANALDGLKARADLVLGHPAGAGVHELIDLLLADEASLPAPSGRNWILLGHTPEGGAMRVPPYGPGLMVAGGSGGGKSTLTTGVLERLADLDYQFCAIDPEGDYQSFTGAAILGDNDRAPGAGEVLSVLEKPDNSIIVNLLGIPLEQRPVFFQSLLPRLAELRASTGRPHWIVVDEAHHLLPASWEPSGLTLPQQMQNLMLITLEPDHVAAPILGLVESLVAVGDEPLETVRQFCRARGLPEPHFDAPAPARGEALFWTTAQPDRAVLFRVAPARTERVRHSRKYAGGDLPADRSFYFRGPRGKLNLRAQNLATFLQMMDGVDDETWVFHLRNHEPSRWFREAIKSRELAEAAEEIEREAELPPAQSRRLIREAVESRYTLAA